MQEYALRVFGSGEIFLVGKDANDPSEVKYDLNKANDQRANATWPGSLGKVTVRSTRCTIFCKTLAACVG